MAVLKSKDVKSLGKQEMNDKLSELKIELIKAKINAKKGSKSRVREIKKAIARILTHKTHNKKTMEKKETKTESKKLEKLAGKEKNKKEKSHSFNPKNKEVKRI